MAAIHDLPAGALQKLSAEFLTGGHTRLWEGWGAADVVPGYNKLYYLRQGRFSIQVDGVAYTGRPGQLFLLPCNSTQTYSADREPAAEKYWIHCSFPCGDKDLLELVSLPLFVEAEDADYVEWLFAQILETGNAMNLEGLLRQKSLLLTLLAYYIEKAGVAMPVCSRDERFFAVMTYIEEHLADNISVESLAGVAHFHPHYFIRYFRRLTGRSPGDYIADTRIARARRLLQEDERPIQEIACMTGFKSAGYFSRQFKARTGYSPSQSRATARRRCGTGEVEKEEQP